MPDHLGLGAHGVEQGAGAGHVLRRQAQVAVRHDVVVGVPVVELRLEHLHLLPRDLGAAHAPDELFALAAEHAAGDDFDPTLVGLSADDVHGGPGERVQRVLTFGVESGCGCDAA